MALVRPFEKCGGRDLRLDADAGGGEENDGLGEYKVG